ncbi:hypothetical protein BDP55DRAFT_176521 [Colletotrichum godetiae]|uniref:C2H2-type domain-containing protein n=1 Tax=Colletotrichum godetiae TaxID=1209918 RepID=A0AAJ0AIG7_9PEZI|nr:uncharacterized protein BDP55DRAFT_176521 [Colletotrichum godetiae]KAK1674501.1 hypothetical protein BDP55DRAFT_176521 [Colletotrichum godetiae]
MPAAGTGAAATFGCQALGCTSTYSSQSNLNRHIKAKHGVYVQMPCGKLRQDHGSNSRRHKLRCPDCRAIQSLPPLDANLEDLDNAIERVWRELDDAYNAIAGSPYGFF